MALCRAVIDGEVEIVREMLARGEDPNKNNRFSTMGPGPIECAMSLLSLQKDADVVRDVFACIELCLDAGADPNVMWDGPTTYGDCGTPLGEAVTQARPEFVRLLLSAGADPNVPPDQDGLTILHHACDLGGNEAWGYEVVRLLLAAGAYTHPFRDAVAHGYHRLWPLFLQAGAAIPDEREYDWKSTQAWRKEQHRSALAKGTSWGDVEASMYLALAERYDYLATIEEAGGFKFYQKHHTHALAALLAKKFPAHIPEEIFPRVVAFWAHAGFYVSKAAVETMRAVEAEFTSLGRVVCPQVRRLIDMYRERHPDREDDPRLQRLSDSLAALEVSVGIDPGAETHPIEANFSDSD